MALAFRETVFHQILHAQRFLVCRLQVRQVVDTLRSCAHQAFPITPDVRKALDSAEPFDLHGVVPRDTLLLLLLHRIGMFQPDASGDIPPAQSHIPSTQAVGWPPRLSVGKHSHFHSFIHLFFRLLLSLPILSRPCL